MKVHPVGYIEFVEQDGRTLHMGPRNEAEESKAQDEWTVSLLTLTYCALNKRPIQKRRAREVSKLREDHERRVTLYNGYLDRLERKAQTCKAVGEDGKLELQPRTFRILTMSFRRMPGPN